MVRHPGTRLYSTYFDKIPRRTSDQPDLSGTPATTALSLPASASWQTRWRRPGDGDEQFINEHVEPQADICNPKKQDFDGVFRLEDSVRRDRGHVTGLDRHGVRLPVRGIVAPSTRAAPRVQVQGGYSEFPVSDVEATRVAHALRRAARRSTRRIARTSTCSGTGRPRWDTQLDSCPKIKWSEELLESGGRGEDAKHLRELEAQGLLNPDVDNGKLPPREELAKPRVPGQEEGSFESAEGGGEPSRRRSSSSSRGSSSNSSSSSSRSSSRNSSSSSSSKGSLCPPLSAGTSSSRTIEAMPVVLPSNANANQKEVKRGAPGTWSRGGSRWEVAAKKARRR